MVCKPGGSDGDQNRQRAVVGRGVIADAVEDVGEKADNDAGDISAQCSDQRTADVVQIQRQVQPRCKVGEKIIDQQPHDTENQEIFPVRLAFPGQTVLDARRGSRLLRLSGAAVLRRASLRDGVGAFLCVIMNAVFFHGITSVNTEMLR